MDSLGEEFAAGSAFAEDENGGRKRGDAGDEPVDRLHRLVVARHVVAGGQASVGIVEGGAFGPQDAEVLPCPDDGSGEDTVPGGGILGAEDL